MTAVFVHGVPETDAIWSPLVTALAGQGVTDVTRLSPPGFGAPAPDGWDATPAAYVAWLAGELEAIDGPIDLVGHDWGTGHVLGLVAEEPGTIRSWATDCAGLVNPDYVWHDLAQVWQTPAAGEEAIGAMLGLSTEDRTSTFLGLGLPAEIAGPMAAASSEEMGRCILGLYRAAAQPALAELGRRVSAADRPPGLFINATGDPYVGSELGAASAAQLGAEQLMMEGNGHWWMVEDPKTAAAGLARFWAGL